jgi:hypothetical protein
LRLTRFERPARALTFQLAIRFATSLHPGAIGGGNRPLVLRGDRGTCHLEERQVDQRRCVLREVALEIHLVLDTT